LAADRRRVRDAIDRPSDRRFDLDLQPAGEFARDRGVIELSSPRFRLEWP